MVHSFCTEFKANDGISGPPRHAEPKKVFFNFFGCRGLGNPRARGGWSRLDLGGPVDGALFGGGEGPPGLRRRHPPPPKKRCVYLKSASNVQPLKYMMLVGGWVGGWAQWIGQVSQFAPTPGGGGCLSNPLQRALWPQAVGVSPHRVTLRHTPPFSQRAHSANHYAVYPGNTPANHPPYRSVHDPFNTASGGADFRTLGPVATGGGKQPTFRTAHGAPPPPPPHPPCQAKHCHH